MSWFSQRRRSKADRPAVVRGSHDDPSLTDEQLIAQRTRWFEMYIALKNVIADESGGPYSCPCCGHITLSERGAYEICGECGWEDDGQDDHDAHLVRGGPNGRAAYVNEGGNRLPHRPPADPA